MRKDYSESYMKYIWREDWFLAIEKELKEHFKKDKSLKTKELR